MCSYAVSNKHFTYRILVTHRKRLCFQHFWQKISASLKSLQRPKSGSFSLPVTPELRATLLITTKRVNLLGFPRKHGWQSRGDVTKLCKQFLLSVWNDSQHFIKSKTICLFGVSHESQLNASVASQFIAAALLCNFIKCIKGTKHIVKFHCTSFVIRMESYKLCWNRILHSIHSCMAKAVENY